MKYRKRLAVACVALILAAQWSSAAAAADADQPRHGGNADAVAALVLSGDARAHPSAMQGAPAMLMNDPASVRAGEPITVGAIVAALAVTNTVLSLADLALCVDNAELEIENLIAELGKFDDPDAALARFKEINSDRQYLADAELEALQRQFVAERLIVAGGKVGGTLLSEIFSRAVVKQIADRVLKTTGKNISKPLSNALGAVLLPLTLRDLANSAPEAYRLRNDQYDLATTWRSYFFQRRFDRNHLLPWEPLFDVGSLIAGSGDLGELVLGGEFTTAAALNHWIAGGAMSGLDSFGPIVAPASSIDGRFGLVHTGLGEASSTGSIVQTFVPLKSSKAVFNIRYNFVTTEYPRWLNSEYNDSFSIVIKDVTSGAERTLSSFSGSLNQIFTAGDPVIDGLPDTVLDRAGNGAGATGWITKSSGILMLRSGCRYQIMVRIDDVGDTIWDSALLIEKISVR